MPSKTKTKTKNTKKQTTTTKTTIKPTTKPGINITITNEVKQPEAKKRVRRNKTKSVLSNFLDANQNQKVQTFGVPIPNQAPLSTHQVTQLGLAPPMLPPPPVVPALPAPPILPALPAPPINNTINNNIPPHSSDKFFEFMSALMPMVMSNNLYTNNNSSYDPIYDDPVYKAISDPVQKEAFINNRFEIIDNEVTKQAQDEVAKIQATPEYTALTPAEQQKADDIARYQEIIKKTMAPSRFKAAGTAAANKNKDPLYVHSEEYLTAYSNALESKRLANDREIATKEAEITTLNSGVASTTSTKTIARLQTEIHTLEADNLIKENLLLKAEEESKKYKDYFKK